MVLSVCGPSSENLDFGLVTIRANNLQDLQVRETSHCVTLASGNASNAGG